MKLMPIKKIGLVLCAIFFLLPVLSIGQPFQSIFANGDGTTEWVYVWGDEFGRHNDTIFVQKDTVVNGITYKKLVQSYYWQATGQLLREDINTGTVWGKTLQYFGHPDDTVERVIIRMDLNVGDTFDISNIRLHPGTYPDSFNVVDRIRYINGLKHIYFKGIYATYNEPYTLIEGVGPNMAILWKYAIKPAHAWSGGFYLLCSYKNGQKTGYENKAYGGTCWQYTKLDKPIDAQGDEITLYPLPARTVVNIESKTGQKIHKIQIINQTGKQIKEVTAPVITSLEIEELPAGYYYLKMCTTDGYLTTKSIIKS